MIIGSVITGVGYCLYYFANNILILVIASCLYSFGFAAVTQMPIALLMTMWFNKNRATFMSVAYAGGGIGGAIWAQVVARLIAGPGWRLSFVYMGILAAVSGVLICLFLVKKCPQEIGQTPYEGKPGAAEKQLSDKEKARLAEKAAENSWQGVTKKVAVKSGAFWMLALALFCIGIMAAGVTQQMSNYLMKDLGWTAAAAGNVVSVFTLTAVAGMFLGGMLMDRIGPVGGVLFACVSSAIAIAALLFAGLHPAAAFVYAIFYGLGQLLPKIAPAILVTTCFGQKEYASIFSFINFIFLLGCAFGSTIVGIIADTAGYNVVWIVVVVICGVVFLGAAGAVAGGKKLRKKYPNEAVSAQV